MRTRMRDPVCVCVCMMLIIIIDIIIIVAIAQNNKQIRDEWERTDWLSLIALISCMFAIPG